MRIYVHPTIVASLAAGALARDYPNCQSGSLSSNQVCNTTLDPWARATALVSAFTLAEKIANTGDDSPGVSRLGLPAYEWWNEALHGVASSPGVSFAPSGNFSYATSFPQPIVLAASFDMALVRAVSTTTSTEARAFANAGRAGLNYWTPNINPFRDPRWGRGQEVPGEDPFLAAAYVRELIPGLQGGSDPDPYWKLVATCKHFAGYDIENWKGHKRYGFDAVISRPDLQDYYLVPFRACVRDAKVQSVMCSYNAVNGVPSCADPWLLQSVLRDQWGFGEGDDGGKGGSSRWVTADCDALSNVWQDHHYGQSAADAAALSMNAGTDLDCGDFWPKNLQAAYQSKLVNDTVLNRSLIRRYASLVTLGWFDQASKQPYRQIGWDAVATTEATALALRAAVEGLVLLKNDNGALPLKSGGTKVIAVIGPLATATTQMQGNYYGIARKISTVVSALKDAGYTVNGAQGCSIAGSSTSDFSVALSAATGADAIVYVGGIDTSVEAEGKDREEITWPGQQLSLIKQVAAAAGAKPFVVVQMGTVLDSSSLVSEKGVDALLWAGYPGQDGGKAIVNVLLGHDAPAGRLPVTQYPGEYVGQVDMTDMALQPGSNNPGRTYKWYSKTPVFPFGHGLHYTTFNVSFSAGSVPLPETFTTASLTTNSSGSAPASLSYPDQAPFFSLLVSVKNTGSVTSDYVVLAFVKGRYGPSPYPNKSLAAFARLHSISPGDTASAILDVKLGSISRSDKDGNLVLWPGNYTITLDIDAPVEWDFEISGDQVVLEELAPSQ